MADASSTSPPSKETVTLRLPSGEMVDAIVPAGFSDADLKSYVRMKQPGLFGPPAGVQKPQVDMQTGAAPIATSFATQLSNLPRNLWEGSFFGEIGNPRVKAAHEARIKAMEAPGMEGVKNTFQAANPVATDASGVDWGATAANLLPYAAAARGLRTPDVNTADALAAAKAVGKLAAQHAASKIPIAGELVGRPSLLAYLKALQTKAPAPETPPALKKVPIPPVTGFKGPYQEPTPASRQVSPPPVTGFKGPYEPPPPVAPNKVTPPPVTGFKGPYKPPAAAATEISPSKVSSTPPESPTPVSAQTKADLLSRLRVNAANIQKQASPTPSEGPPLRVGGKAVPAGTDLTSALQKSLPQNRIQGKVMQVIRKEGGNSIGAGRLAEAPELQGVSKADIDAAVTKLASQGKIWHETTGGGAHESSYTVALKKR